MTELRSTIIQANLRLPSCKKPQAYGASVGSAVPAGVADDETHPGSIQERVALTQLTTKITQRPERVACRTGNGSAPYRNPLAVSRTGSLEFRIGFVFTVGHLFPLVVSQYSSLAQLSPEPS